MSKMYIANCTRQHTRVMYRLDYTSQGELNPNRTGQLAKHQDIPAGQQRPVGGDLHIRQIEDIEAQLRPYGLLGTVDLKHRLEGRVTWLYSIDIPVSEDDIRYAMDHNNGTLTAEGRQRRLQAAVGADAAIVNQAQEHPLNMSVEYEELDTEDRTGNGPLLAEGVKVDRSAPGPKGKPAKVSA